MRVDVDQDNAEKFLLSVALGAATGLCVSFFKMGFAGVQSFAYNEGLKDVLVDAGALFQAGADAGLGEGSGGLAVCVDNPNTRNLGFFGCHQGCRQPTVAPHARPW